MNLLNEGHILLFLLQILVLLGCARTLSVIFESFKVPAIVGEILAGILLGPTLLGRISPSLQLWLFPAEQIQSTMLETVSWLGVFFLLLASGFHVDIKKAVHSGRAAILIGIVGVLLPIAIGIPVFSTFDPIYWGDKANAITFTLFLSVAASITAISVVARTLNDLEISKTSKGSLALSSCAINDIFGWFLFTIVISLVTPNALSIVQIVGSVLAIIGFVVLSVTYGSKLLSTALRYVKSTTLPQPAASQSLIASLGLLCGAITQWLGIHAILGFFLAGTIARSTKGVSDNLRKSVSDTLHAIFVPLFFATLGLKIDFLFGIVLWPTVIFCAVAIAGKFIGAWLGAKLGKHSQQTSILMGVIFIPGGAMEIVVATLALELQLIGHAIFVAIVFAALASSILAGPLIAIQKRKMEIRESLSE
ncbi:cation:proton antiporter [Winogradskyella sp.]|uniref:cation:proton antiporter n=1 Tax=Winogradskyella sp. TaxID=1883156 RepID=UPI0025E23895|nr:cation:proton antiporter [Winogradskyella sp.]MBT8243658.1 cation:proton antiporter [Winogradskyella sp.]